MSMVQMRVETPSVSDCEKLSGIEANESLRPVLIEAIQESVYGGAVLSHVLVVLGRSTSMSLRFLLAHQFASTCPSGKCCQRRNPMSVPRTFASRLGVGPTESYLSVASPKNRIHHTDPTVLFGGVAVFSTGDDVRGFHRSKLILPARPTNSR